MDLWRFFAASSTDGKYNYGHSFCAPTEAEAKGVCLRNNWHFDGEIVETRSVSDEDLAMIEKSMNGSEVH